MSISHLTSQDIKKMSYNELIGLVQETNRPPGGINTLNNVSIQTRLNSESKVLEIGTSTGITAVELARLSGCHIDAIDINDLSLQKARVRAEEYGVSNNINFAKHDATALPYEDNSYDVVFFGNVISIISDREQGLKESLRVLKPGGYIVFVPMYYLQDPSQELLDRVSAAIQVKVTHLTKEYWLNFLGKDDLELFYQKDYCFDAIPENRVDAFSKKILSRAHLQALTNEAQAALTECYSEYMLLFRDNLAQMGFSTLIYRKCAEPIEEDLFTATAL